MSELSRNTFPSEVTIHQHNALKNRLAKLEAAAQIVLAGCDANGHMLACRINDSHGRKNCDCECAALRAALEDSDE
jgi:hypothetical protein